MEHLDQRCKGGKIMKKYTQPATNIFLSLTIICIVMIVAGAVTFFMAPEQLNLILFFWGIGIPFGTLFVCIWLACAYTCIMIGNESIILPVTRVPRLSFKRNQLNFSDIKCVEIIFRKGDGIISKDTNMYKFVLNNGSSFTETFFSYGKKQEQEIVNILKSKVMFV